MSKSEMKKPILSLKEKRKLKKEVKKEVNSNRLIKPR